MNRRHFCTQLSRGAALAGLMTSAPALPAQSSSSGSLKITKVKAILTAPARTRLCVVKVETSEPGLYGLGCATFNQRPLPVITAIEEYLDLFARGRDADNIEDLWQAMFQRDVTSE